MRTWPRWSQSFVDVVERKRLFGKYGVNVSNALIGELLHLRRNLSQSRELASHDNRVDTVTSMASPFIEDSVGHTYEGLVIARSAQLEVALARQNLWISFDGSQQTGQRNNAFAGFGLSTNPPSRLLPRTGVLTIRR